MQISILDYGLGNIFSVERAIVSAGYKTPKLVNNPNEILESDFIILPGVGAFPDGIQGLQSRELLDVISEYVETGKPLLGICLGMQMLTSRGVERSATNGLNLIPGETIKIKQSKKNGFRRLPFVGWAPINYSKEGVAVRNHIREPEETENELYFVHSYHVITEDPADTKATYDYDGLKIAAIIEKNNVTGFQFHPEKSGPHGIKLLGNYINSKFKE